MQAHAKNEGFYFETSYGIPCKSLLQKRDPHFIGVGVGASRVNLIFINWQIVINEDVIPDTKSPKPTVEHSVIFRGTHEVRVFGNYLEKDRNVYTLLKNLHLREADKGSKASFLVTFKDNRMRNCCNFSFYSLATL